MIYIDFDDVIVNTSEVMVKKRNNDNNAPLKYFNDPDYIINLDWANFLQECSVLNNSVEIIKNMNPKKVAILTKAYTINNEGLAKIKYIRSKGIKCNIILVPVDGNKADVVDPVGSILVDDSLHNLDDWHKAGGISIFYDRFHKNADGWGQPNTKYDKIDSLDELNKYLEEL